MDHWSGAFLDSTSFHCQTKQSPSRIRDLQCLITSRDASAISAGSGPHLKTNPGSGSTNSFLRIPRPYNPTGEESGEDEECPHMPPPRLKQNTISLMPGGCAQRWLRPSGLLRFCSTFSGGTTSHCPSSLRRASQRSPILRASVG